MNDTRFTPYDSWRTDPTDRAEDAAYVFGHYLIRHCRNEALSQIPEDAPAAFREAAEKAVDVALHNVMDLLEGFWRTPAGPNHEAQFALHVEVLDEHHSIVETQQLSPCRLDLPIGYWAWCEDFQVATTTPFEP